MSVGEGWALGGAERVVRVGVNRISRLAPPGESDREESTPENKARKERLRGEGSGGGHTKGWKGREGKRRAGQGMERA